MTKILAIDQGTTSTKALLVEESGKGEVIRAIEHKQIYPRPGWVEHDPEEIIANIRSCIDECDEHVRIGIANQGESCLAWDGETKKAVSPIIVWQDSRTADLIAHLKEHGGEETTIAKAGLPLDPYFSASKLGWIYANIPEAKKLHRAGKLRMGTTDAFFLDRLAGRFVTDKSTASRTSLMNLSQCTWDTELCDLFGVPMDTLPEIVPTTGDFGSISSKKGSLQVAASVVDQQAALYGHGCVRPGDLKITFGTGAFALAVTGEQPVYSIQEGLLPTVAWQIDCSNVIYALDGGVYAAGSAVNWAKGLGLFDSYDQLDGIEGRAMIERGLVFVPALTGLGCPYWERSAGGTWIGLTLDTTPFMLVQSILEGIALRTAEVIESMKHRCVLSQNISIDGGLSANPYFCQFLADVLQSTVTVKESKELTAFGTAMLAGAKPAGPGTTSPTREYFPDNNTDVYLEKFKNAVERSRNWFR